MSITRRSGEAAESRVMWMSSQRTLRPLRQLTAPSVRRLPSGWRNFMMEISNSSKQANNEKYSRNCMESSRNPQVRVRKPSASMW
ncbi:hypothetical protein D9M70_650150 [compost metagenome]